MVTYALCKVLFTCRQDCLGIIIYFLYCLSNYIIADTYNYDEKNSSLRQNFLVGIFISCIVCQIITNNASSMEKTCGNLHLSGQNLKT